MSLPWFKKSAWLVLGLALVAASCDQTVNAPEAPAPAVQNGLLGLGGTTTTSTSEYRLVRDVLPLPVPDLSLSNVIGISGGSVSLLGHSLVVPAGAVSVPTVFTLVALTNGYIEVDVTALIPNLLSTLNIGAQGFAKPVTLTLSYARSPDALTPSKLLIVYENGSKLEPLTSTVNTTTKTVSAQLKHFSKYAMAEN